MFRDVQRIPVRETGRRAVSLSACQSVGGGRSPPNFRGEIFIARPPKNRYDGRVLLIFIITSTLHRSGGFEYERTPRIVKTCDGKVKRKSHDTCTYNCNVLFYSAFIVPVQGVFAGNGSMSSFEYALLVSSRLYILFTPRPSRLSSGNRLWCT